MTPTFISCLADALLAGVFAYTYAETGSPAYLGAAVVIALVGLIGMLGYIAAQLERR